MQWTRDTVLLGGFAIACLVWLTFKLNEHRERSMSDSRRWTWAAIDLAPALVPCWIIFVACREVGGFSIQQSLILTTISVWLFLVTMGLMRQMDTFARWTRFDVPLVEVIALNITLKRDYFLEALKLSEEEIDGPPNRVHGIRIRLQVWKGHYSGDVAFYSKEGAILKEESIWQFPTTSTQFPVRLAEILLLPKVGDDFSQYVGVMGMVCGPERLEVLLSHKAFTVRGIYGRFGSSPNSGAQDLVIPRRTSDLAQLVDRFGHDDPDWRMATGQTRRYQREGRWADWSVVATNPEALSWTTEFMDKSAVTLND